MDKDWLATEFRDLLNTDQIVVSRGKIRDFSQALYLEEYETLTNSVAVRVSEFTAGRSAARSAIGPVT